jgi:hypothetical protein
MAYQFIHVEGYGREAGKGKAGGHTVASIAAEAERAQGACPHVTAPAEPVRILGCSPAAAAALATRWAENAKDARGHAYRKDGLCLLGGVVSMPADTSDKQWKRFKSLAVKWLKKKYSRSLVSVIEHTDEPHPHLHFYAVPQEKARFDSIHQGLAAAAAADPGRGKRGRMPAEAKVARKTSRDAYREAMRSYQDDFYDGVGRWTGLARLGPKIQRKPRAAWKAENAARQADLARIVAMEEHLLNLQSDAEAVANSQKAAQAVWANINSQRFSGLSREVGDHAKRLLSGYPAEVQAAALEAALKTAQQLAPDLTYSRTRDIDPNRSR